MPTIQSEQSIPSYPRSHILSFLFLLLLFIGLPCKLLAIDSLSYKIGQMVMTGFYPGSNFEDTLYYDIEHRNLGGVIFMGYNLNNPTQIANLSTSLQAAADTPLLISTDQEGGIVARLDEQNGFSKTDKAIVLGNANSESRTRAQAALMAGWLKSTGINTNLAPVADVNIYPASPAIGRYGRSFSANPTIVSDHIYWFCDEMKSEKIVTALKHFPGHGSAEGDSHDGFTDISDSWSEQELIPYSSMIDTAYTGMVMTAHLFNENIDTMYPATLSKSTLTDILRDSLGFNGVIISDDMNMGAINNVYGFTESVIAAVNAGVDILLYVGNEKFDKSIVKQINTVLKNVINSGSVSQDRIDESYKRIMKLKEDINTGPISIDPIIADDFHLMAYPNPFNPQTCITLDISETLHESASISFYSIDGKRVQKYDFNINGAGNYSLYWDGTDHKGAQLPSGTYIYRTNINNIFYSGKVTLLK